MKLRKDKQKNKQVRLNKKPTKRKIYTKYNLTKQDIEIILLIIILLLILFVLIPLMVYSSGTLESTNYYYKLNETATTLYLTRPL